MVSALVPCSVHCRAATVCAEPETESSEFESSSVGVGGTSRFDGV